MRRARRRPRPADLRAAHRSRPSTSLGIASPTCSSIRSLQHASRRQRRLVGGSAGAHLPRQHVRGKGRGEPAASARARPSSSTSSLARIHRAGAVARGRPRHARRNQKAPGRETVDPPLFDTDLSRRHLEEAYTVMWARHQAGDRPASFDVEARPEGRRRRRLPASGRTRDCGCTGGCRCERDYRCRAGFAGGRPAAPPAAAPATRP